MILRIGLTPTDVLHAEELMLNMMSRPPRSAWRYRQRTLGIPVPEFIRMMRTMVIEKIAIEVFKKLIYEEVGKTMIKDAMA